MAGKITLAGVWGEGDSGEQAGIAGFSVTGPGVRV